MEKYMKILLIFIMVVNFSLVFGKETSSNTEDIDMSVSITPPPYAIMEKALAEIYSKYFMSQLHEALLLKKKECKDNGGTSDGIAALKHFREDCKILGNTGQLNVVCPPSKITFTCKGFQKDKAIDDSSRIYVKPAPARDELSSVDDSAVKAK